MISLYFIGCGGNRILNNVTSAKIAKILYFSNAYTKLNNAGIIYATKSSFHFSDSIVSNINVASSNGAIFTYQSLFSINNSTFTDAFFWFSYCLR